MSTYSFGMTVTQKPMTCKHNTLMISYLPTALCVVIQFCNDLGKFRLCKYKILVRISGIVGDVFQKISKNQVVVWYLFEDVSE